MNKNFTQSNPQKIEQIFYSKCHPGLDPESKLRIWIPACAGMTTK